MIKIGDEVFVMSAPGRFRVTAVAGNVLTIRNGAGDQRTVYDANVRLIQAKPSSDTVEH